jgi:lysophospholipase L1-like esterase
VARHPGISARRSRLLARGLVLAAVAFLPVAQLHPDAVAPRPLSASRAGGNDTATHPGSSPPARASRSRGAAPRVAAVVGLGDSVPAGTGCGCTDYVQLVAQDLAARQGAPVPASNLAVPGATSSDLMDQLNDPATLEVLRGADVVIVTIGANDVDPAQLTDPGCTPQSCYADDLVALRAHLDTVLSAVHAAAPQRPAVLVTGYWNVFLDGAAGAAQGSAYVTGSDALTRATNAVVAAAAQAHGDRYVDIYTPFKGDGSRDDTALLAPDGDHPDADGHRVIAAALLDALG